MAAFPIGGPLDSEDEFEVAEDAVQNIEADFEVLDIELPDATQFQTAHWRDERYDVVRDLGTVYEGRVLQGQRSGWGTLWDETRSNCVVGNWRSGRLVALQHARFTLGDQHVVRVHAEDGLITSTKHNFVARIRLQPLDLVCGNFSNIRRDIEGCITIISILEDELRAELQKCRAGFVATLQDKQRAVGNTAATARHAQQDMFLLYLLMQEIVDYYNYEDDDENILLLTKIFKNDLFSQELSDAARVAYQLEQTAFVRNKTLPLMMLSEIGFSWRNEIHKCIRDSIINIKLALQNALPTRVFVPSGPMDILQLPDHQLFTCTVQDIQLFVDLEVSSRQHSRSDLALINFHDFIQNYVSQLWSLLIVKISKSRLHYLPDESVYTNPVFLQLFKTFLELMNIICRENNQEIKHLIIIKKDSDLQITECPTRKIGPYENSLQILINLLNHFKPGDIKNYKFNYKFSFFQVNRSWFKKVTGYVTNYFDNSITNIAEEYVIWLYYIHNTFSGLLIQEECEETDNKNALSSFLNSLMDLFKTVIKNQAASLEKVRILSSNVIKYGMTISPYFIEQSFINAEDMNLLQQQAEYIKDFVTANEHAPDEITTIVDIYQVFWDERKNLLTELRNKYSTDSSFIIELISRLNRFIQYVFNMNIYNNKFLIFLRSYNEFIRLFRGTNYPWYVKTNDLVSRSFVKLINEDKESHFVEDTTKFLDEYSNSSKSLPRHYLLEVAIHFLVCAEKFLEQKKWSINEKVEAVSDLLLLMGRSLINFKQLPNAVDFDKFFAVFTEPFDRVTTNSLNIDDYKRRLGSLENYYKYTIELNVMRVSKALELCRQRSSDNSLIDYSFNSHILQSAFNVYLNKFNTYVDDYILQKDFKIIKLVDKVKSKAKSMDISKWTSDYKQNHLPEFLAGLSAIWSALESKDVICQKQVIKPHCIQILCVLRLLGVDNPTEGISSHLAQVLTGQGKSIVLSLLATTLVLTGNLVRIVCYNEYLANRDRKDFETFYKAFNIKNKILNPNIGGSKYNLRKFVDELLTKELSVLHLKDETKPFSKTILLIDEVDVFFSPIFYGNTYNPCTTTGSEALADLQIKIWNLTSNSCAENDLRETMQKYIDEEFAQSTDNKFVNLVRNNRSILNSHVEEMISNAVEVRNSSPDDWYSRKFKLRDDGFLITVEDHGEHKTSTYYRYKNAFIYFKLKKNNFDHKNFENYGYLNIACGHISYAMLPKDYQLILGVTGTLKQLSEAETRAVTSYGINCGSDMPTFFGGSSKLLVSNFSIKETEEAWNSCVLDSILCAVGAGRAVLVFFEDEYAVEAADARFASHLSRYSLLTGNEGSAAMAACVDEAGTARRITLATRHMGRGVDFKANDSAVEAKGGVHVIQTFFSVDVKEETQIKGRTARKDNRGSYELIVCREHLDRASLPNSACTYDELNAARRQLGHKQGQELAEKIEKSQIKHDATMKFLRSFYKYNPNNRDKYFQNYPFIDFDP